MFNITIEKNNNIIEVKNFGVPIIADTKDSILEILKEELKEENNSYTINLIQTILSYINN